MKVEQVTLGGAVMFRLTIGERVRTAPAGQTLVTIREAISVEQARLHELQRALADAQAGYIEILEAANKSSHAAVMLAVGKLAKQKDGQKRGGKATAQGKAPGVAQWRQEAINVAKGLIANGRAQHEVAAIGACPIFCV